MSTLEGERRFAIVTGASRGVGRATALSFARRGLSVGLVGRASSELEQTRLLALESGAPDARCWFADLGDVRATESVGRLIAAELPAIEVLVNNAGVAHRTSFEDTSTESFEEQLASATPWGPSTSNRKNPTARAPACATSGK